jgi:hypothetical protein
MFQGFFSRHSRIVGAVVSCLGIAVLSGAPARAALISTDACDSSALTQPFAPWGQDLYKLVPGGSFENGAPGWTIGGGAGIVPGSEPYGVTGTVGNSSLNLPAGATVTSPVTCVDAAYPTFRFFASNATPLSTMLVSVVYSEPLLGEVTVPVGVVTLSDGWQPTLPMLTASAVGGLTSGGTADVALRFTELTGDTHIDDVYVDPRMR